MTKEEKNLSIEHLNNVSQEKNNEARGDLGYSVNINGEIVDVDVNSPEEYACLLNCLDGYVYGLGCDDEEDNEDEDIEDEIMDRIISKVTGAGCKYAKTYYDNWVDMFGGEAGYDGTYDDKGHPYESIFESQIVEQAWQQKIDYSNSASCYLDEIGVELTEDESEYIENHEDIDFYDPYYLDSIIDFIDKTYHR